MGMSGRVQIKVHNVLHDESEYDTTAAEAYLEACPSQQSNVDVRIASGHTNSPLYITVDGSSVSLTQAKSIARAVVRGFTEFVSGIDVDQMIRDDNIRVIVE